MSTPFVSLVAFDDAHTLAGQHRGQPVTAGQTIAAHGLFEDRTDTGIGIFFVLKTAKDGSCDVAPLGARNEYWRSHLAQRASCEAVFLKKHGQELSPTKEVFTRWQILGEPGANVDFAGHDWLGKVGVDEAKKQIIFLRTYVLCDPATALDNGTRQRKRRRRDEPQEALDAGEAADDDYNEDGVVAEEDLEVELDAETRMLKGVDEQSKERGIKPKLSEIGSKGSKGSVTKPA